MYWRWSKFLKKSKNDPVSYHGVGRFNVENGIGNSTGRKPTYSDIFGRWIVNQAKICPDLVSITPAMCEGSGLVEFAATFPERYFDVGIAEQHAVTFAAGLACAGKHPVVAIYSTFLQRAYDQLIHDVAMQNLPVLFAIDRAGLVGADGPTHAGAYDLSYLNCIPNMVIATPSDEKECYQLLSACYHYQGPAAVRYPRGSSHLGLDVLDALSDNVAEYPIGKGVIRATGENIAILAFGSMLAPALEAAKKLNATIADMRFVKPLDLELIKQLAATHQYIVTVEENAIIGGAGSTIAQVLNSMKIACPVLNLGLPDNYVDHGDHAHLLSMLKLDSHGIVEQVNEWLAL